MLKDAENVGCSTIRYQEVTKYKKNRRLNNEKLKEAFTICHWFIAECWNFKKDLTVGTNQGITLGPCLVHLHVLAPNFSILAYEFSLHIFISIAN